MQRRALAVALGDALVGGGGVVAAAREPYRSVPVPGHEGDPSRISLWGWPASTMAGLPYDPPHYHRLTSPGSYTLTPTAYSSGCDGSQVQTGMASFTGVVPE